MEKANQKHLMLEDKNFIEQALNQDITFKEIAKFLSRDSSTISKEVKKHGTRKEPNRFNGLCNSLKQAPCVCALVVQSNHAD